ncbi:MAG: DMT family transporter [Burkholderiaceae bacterium]
MNVAPSAVAASPQTAMLRAMPWIFVLIWSTGFIVARYGMPLAPPMKFLAWRFALSILCFLLWIAWARVAWPRSRAQWLHLAVVGALMQAGYLGGVWTAVKAGMGSGLASLIVGLQPVLTAVWLSGMGGADEQVNRRQWAGLLLGFAGLALVVGGKLGQGTEVTWLTLGATGVALCGITIGTLYQKRFVLPCDVRSASAVQLLAGLALVLPLSLFETESIQWTAQFAGAMAWSVLVLTLGGSSLLYLLIQKGAATQVTSLLYMVPPCTALLAWLLFAEPITLATLGGIVLTAWGVSWVVKPSGIRHG